MGVAVEIAVGLPLGEPSVEDVLDMLHNEVDSHCGAESKILGRGRRATWSGCTEGHTGTRGQDFEERGPDPPE